jgi:hypothetical protein
MARRDETTGLILFVLGIALLARSRRDVVGEQMQAIETEIGDRVREMQRQLNYLGFGLVTIDGRLGSETQIALDRFARSRGLALASAGPALRELADRLRAASRAANGP